MPPYLNFRTTAAIAAILIAPTVRGADAGQASVRQPPARVEAKPLPARTAPTEYQAHAQAGTVTIAADFAAHGVPTFDGTFSSEGYIVVEAAFFGPAGARLNLSFKDFTLRINGKKGALAAQSYENAFRTLSDPFWEPPVSPESKSSKTSLNGGGGDPGAPPPTPPKMPMNLVLAMEQKVKMASLPEGESALPVAGLIFFPYGGKATGIHSIELNYNGAAGKATLPLQ
jgi:hypothetical protein